MAVVIGPKAHFFAFFIGQIVSVPDMETKRFVLNALLQGCGSLNGLGRKAREDIELLMEHYVLSIKITPRDYKNKSEPIPNQEKVRIYSAW